MSTLAEDNALLQRLVLRIHADRERQTDELTRLRREVEATERRYRVLIEAHHHEIQRRQSAEIALAAMQVEG